MTGTLRCSLRWEQHQFGINLSESLAQSALSYMGEVLYSVGTFDLS